MEKKKTLLILNGLGSEVYYSTVYMYKIAHMSTLYYTWEDSSNECYKNKIWCERGCENSLTSP